MLCALYGVCVVYSGLLAAQSAVPGFSCVPSSDDLVCVVNRVTPGLAAEAAGVQVGDAVIGVNGQPIDRFSRDIATWLSQQPAGTSFSLGVNEPAPNRQPTSALRKSLLLTVEPLPYALATSDVFRLETIARVSQLWEWTVTGAVYLGLAVVLVWLRPGSVPARLMLLAGSGLAFTFLAGAVPAPTVSTTPGLQIRVLITGLSALGVLIGLPALAHLFMVFPVSTPLYERLRLLGVPTLIPPDWVPFAYAATTAPIVFAVIAWSPFLRFTGSLLWHAQLAWSFYGTLVMLVALGPIAVWSLRRTSATGSNARRRSDLKWVLALFGFSMVLFLPLTFWPGWVSFVNPSLVPMPFRLPLVPAVFAPYSGWFWNGVHMPVGTAVLAVAVLWPLLWLAIGGGVGLLYALPTALVAFGLIALPSDVAQISTVLVGAVLLIMALWAVTYNFRQPDTLATRVQVKWVMASLVIVTLGWVLLNPAATLLENEWEGPGWFVRTALNVLMPLIWILFPLATVLSILRYRLFDLDVIINKAVVFGVLTIVLVTLFVLLSVLSHLALTRIIGLDPPVLESMNAVVIALVFQPVRSRTQAMVDRLLPSSSNLALLFLDIVGSTQLAARIGDADWRDLLERFRSIVRRVVRRHSGREVHAAGDGFFVAFEDPVACLACAMALPSEVRRVGLAIRTGLHLGPCETRGEDLSGLHVHIAARIMALAGPDEVLLSGALTEALQPSDLRYSFRGEQVLRGVPGRWAIYAVDQTEAERVAGDS
jgi:class 3 adenylate cyclase